MKKLFLLISLFLLMSLMIGCSSLGNPSPDSTSPKVSSATPPNNDTNVAVKATISVTFSETMNQSSAQNAFTVVNASADAVSGSFSWSGNTMTFTPDTQFDYNTKYTCTIGVGAEDSAGNTLASLYTWSFTSLYSDDTTQPEVSSVTPSNNDTNVAVKATISVTFNEAMDESSAQNAFTMVSASASSVSGNFSWIGKVMIFTPATALAANTTYTCTEGTGAEDLTGNLLASAKTWSFTTGSPDSDTFAPTVIFTVPDDDATAVLVSSSISVTFSEAMNTSSAQNAFTVVDPSDNAVSGSFSPWSGNTMIFTPDTSLSNNTKYTGTVGTGAKDQADNQMTALHTWSFTTIHLPPTVVSVFPSDGATNVPVSSTLSATFSQPMYKPSIEDGGVACPGLGGGAITWNGDGTTATFTPSASLSSSTTYACTINTGVRDLDGNYLAESYSWSFTTASP
jgi:hypothetical protein